MSFDVRTSASHFARGLLMGSADVIPGVSGGTMALIVGIYERLIDSISSGFSAIVAVVRFDAAAVRKHLREVEWSLVAPVGLGVICAIVAASKVIPGLLETHPQQMRGLFFGLVAASIAVPWLRIGRVTLELALIMVVATIAAFVIVGLPVLEAEASPGLVRVFLSAAVAICAMILPGVSGAFLLEVLGIYRPTLHALETAFTMDGAAVLYVAVFIVGAVVGLGSFSKVLDYLLTHFHDRTMAALVGLMAGSLRALWPWQDAGRELRLPDAGDPIGSVLLLLAAGFLFVALLTWWGARRIESGPLPGTASH